MAFTETNDITKPAGSRALSLGDDDIRELKRVEIERQAVDHDRRDDETGAVKTVSPTGTIGYHKKCTLIEASADPTNVANTGILYTKEVSGITELFYIDDAGTIKQITSNGKLNLAATEAVLLTGNQTVAGIKTFSSSPIVPTPTTDYQAATKAYADTKASGTHNHAATDINSGSISGARLTSYDSGWFAVALNTAYSKTHGLGTNKILINVFYSASSDGSNAELVQQSFHSSSASYTGGCYIDSLTTTTLRILTGAGSLSSAQSYNTPGFQWGGITPAAATSGYYRVVALALA